MVTGTRGYSCYGGYGGYGGAARGLGGYGYYGSLRDVRGAYHSQGCTAQAPKYGAEAMHIQACHVASSRGESGCQCCCGDIPLRAGEHGGKAACSTRGAAFCCCVGGRGWSGPDAGSTGATGAHA